MVEKVKQFLNKNATSRFQLVTFFIITNISAYHPADSPPFQ